jgi:hypothetical protein
MPHSLTPRLDEKNPNGETIPDLLKGRDRVINGEFKFIKSQSISIQDMMN